MEAPASTKRFKKPLRLSKPPKQGYSFDSLLSAPQRLLKKPSTYFTDNVEADKGSPRLIMVRSFTTLPPTSIKLGDVLENRHKPPFSVQEFENYLLYDERSPESLFFISWYNSYCKLFHRLQAKTTTPSPFPVENLPDRLARSFAEAIDVFIRPGAAYELNLISSTRSALLRDAAKWANPSIFLETVGEATSNLENSLQRFVQMNMGNAETPRRYFAIIVGILVFLAGVVGVAAFCITRVPRAWRIFALPAFLLGPWISISGNRRTCLLLWLLAGHARQLKPWELNRENILDGTHVDLSTNLARSTTASSNSTECGKHSCPGEDDEKDGYSASSPEISPFAFITHVDNSDLASIPSSSGINVPLTKVESPFTITAQRRAILVGLCWGLAFTIVCLPIALVVPNRR